MFIDVHHENQGEMYGNVGFNNETLGFMADLCMCDYS